MSDTPLDKPPNDSFYLVNRTSGSQSYYDVGDKPCEGAFLVLVPAVSLNDVRVEGYCDKWAIKIPVLREFLVEHGRCIVDFDGANGFTTLEIYDDYRE